MISTSTRDRIHNWAAWSRGGTSHSTSSMTGIVCDGLRRAALGDVWAGHGAIRTLDSVDAQLVERAWKSLPPKHKQLLRWHYIRDATPGLICRRLGIPFRPSSVFDIELAQAEAAIGKALSALVNAECAPRS